MTYPFVQAYHDLGPAKGPRLGFLVHMAEGGGTVGFLSRANRDGVSVHYVIEYSGRTVQMLREDHMHSSIRTTAIRTDNDADGPYGRKAAVAVLGAWADIKTTRGPNHSTIAVEIEGHATTGPNPAQLDSLLELVADVRTRHPDIGLLAHRDFANYKACPGRHIPWERLGGHGPATGGDMAEQIIEFSAPLAFTANDPVMGAASWAASYPHALLPRVKGALKVDATVFIPDGTTPHGHFVRIMTGPAGHRIVAAADVTPVAIAAPADPAPLIKAAVNKALDHVAAAAPAVTTAINEARIR